jgi:hypothetical protein
MWATGELLSDAESIESVSVVLLLDLPSDELSWIALHPTGEWVSERLRLGKRPVQWWYRPHVWPAWNATHRRVIRFWSDQDGCDDAVLDQYYDQDWRRQHRGFGVYPEDHLWRAGQGLREIEDALR